jgi:hypothetical protein
MNNTTFLKNYHRHILDANKEFDNDAEARLNRKIRQSGGDYLYDIMHSMVVRSNWKDHKGYPLKKMFYDNKILVCCISIRKLASMSDMSDKKVQKLLNMMEEAGWIVKHKNAVLRGQIVYAMGTYTIKYISERNRYFYAEFLYKHKALDLLIGEETDILENEIEMIEKINTIKTTKTAVEKYRL